MMFMKKTPKKKVLCIGCSHLSGAYDMNDNVVSPESWAWHLWKYRKCKEQFYTLPNPGQGIMQYAALVHYLDNNNLLSMIDVVILQLTSEPRVIWNSTKFNSYFNSLGNILSSDSDFVDGQQIINPRSLETIFSSNQRRLYELYESKFDNPQDKMAWLDITGILHDNITTADSVFNNTIFGVYYNYIVNTLQKYNIKYIVFDWWGKPTETWDCIKQVEKDEFLFTDNNRSIKDLLLSKNEWHRDKQSVGGHLSSDLAKPIAKYINEDIIKRQLL